MLFSNIIRNGDAAVKDLSKRFTHKNGAMVFQFKFEKKMAYFVITDHISFKLSETNTYTLYDKKVSISYTDVYITLPWRAS